MFKLAREGVYNNFPSTVHFRKFFKRRLYTRGLQTNWKPFLKHLKWKCFKVIYLVFWYNLLLQTPGEERC